MLKSIPLAGAAAIAFFNLAQAEVPRIATDIAPVHSLVAQVMGNLGTPELILPPGASPHGYAMRPSEARALSKADVIFWVSADLTPWLEHSIETLGANATAIELSELPGVTLHAFRENATFETHDHGHDDHDDHGDEEDHDDHHEDHDANADEMAHDDHDDHEGHGDEDHDGDHHAEEAGEPQSDPHDHAGHAHEGMDPHIWLDPANAKVWVTGIAEILSERDPENAETYAANAAEASERLDALISRIEAQVASADGMAFVVFHDAFQYFERRFGISAAGAISVSDAESPSAARVAEIRDLVGDLGVTCIASEPQFNPDLVGAVASASDVRTTVLDPIGTGIEPGPGLYEAVLQGIADGLIACR